MLASGALRGMGGLRQDVPGLQMTLLECLANGVEVA
jgi:hypothetical protein